MKLFRFDPSQTSYADVGLFPNGDQPMRANLTVLAGGDLHHGEVVVGRDGIAIDCGEESWFLDAHDGAAKLAAALLWIMNDLPDLSSPTVGVSILRQYGFVRIG
jgi:hypothetical protein